MNYAVLIWIFITVLLSIIDRLAKAQFGVRVTFKIKPHFTQKGGSTSFNCRWKTLDNSTPISVAILLKCKEPIWSYDIEKKTGTLNNRKRDSRVKINTNEVVMRISNLNCLNSGIYCCEVESREISKSNFSTTIRSRSSFLYIETFHPLARPLIETSKFKGKSNLILRDGETVNLTCSGNIGCPYQAYLAWTTFRGNETEVVFPGDERIATVTELPRRPTEEAGTTRRKSTFTMTVSHIDQDMVISCFLKTPFQQYASRSCSSSTKQLCDSTRPIFVIVPVTADEITVEILGDQRVEEGDDLELACTVHVFPRPTISWEKVDGQRWSLKGYQTGIRNRLTTVDVQIKNDSGTYRCHASNEVHGKMHSAYKDIFVQIYNATEKPDDGEGATSRVLDLLSRLIFASLILGGIIWAACEVRSIHFSEKLEETLEKFKNQSDPSESADRTTSESATRSGLSLSYISSATASSTNTR